MAEQFEEKTYKVVDAYNPTDEPKDTASTQFIKCENCGSNLTFDPETQMLRCEYCGATVDFEKDKQVKELSIENALDTADKWDEVAVMRCENCGAKLVIERNEVAKDCPFCGTSHVRKTEELAGIKPNAVYPFIITENNAEQLAKKWAKKRIFAPSKFKKNLEAKNMRGVFQPCFTFDSQTHSTYNGRLGKRRTRTVRTRNGTRTETYIEWINVSGTISLSYDDITINCGAQLSQKKLNKIMPFKQDTICVYEKKYLAGFVANHYDKDIRTCWGEAKSIIDASIRTAILNKYNCDVIGNLNVSTVHNNVTYKYVLLPMYVLNYIYGKKKKSYEVDVNGNTGKVIGKTPVSFWRVLIAVCIGIAVAVGIYLLGSNYLIS